MRTVDRRGCHGCGHAVVDQGVVVDSIEDGEAKRCWLPLHVHVGGVGLEVDKRPVGHPAHLLQLAPDG